MIPTPTGADNVKMRYQVHVGGRRYRYFDTLAEAVTVVNKVFQLTGVVLGIVAIRA